MADKEHKTSSTHIGIWIGFGMLCGLAGAALILLLSGPRRGQAVELLPAPERKPIVIHVSGGVLAPGVYELARGSRAQDAVEAAGGASEDADLDRVNLARVLQDAQQLYIPRVGEGDVDGVRFPININVATVEQLALLPGIGEITAQAILDYRDSKGPFNRIEDIQKVPGIGPSTFAKIQELISVEG
ncbi:MAG: ComEA family DNA-binding protein [Chloroflexi bacterium]|nr:ComEA family DNA-binding protein [Chloroflexota bacterium]